MMYIDLLGVPYLKGGRTKAGLDCYGLLMELYRRRGVELPEFGAPEEDCLVQGLIDDAMPLLVEVNKPEPYDIVTFKIRPPYTTHIGMVMDDTTKFIHIMLRRHVCVERLDTDGWQRRLTGNFRWIGKK